ncbi:hypothetical protein PI125_g24587 [Phytophthora idaei]|nr:hypothetical protein PI125_g24587 [Phytophthora idaei]KAG3125849.1 hypothetical protein PI126_g22586 [Phytophthora idaei]
MHVRCVILLIILHVAILCSALRYSDQASIGPLSGHLHTTTVPVSKRALKLRENDKTDGEDKIKEVRAGIPGSSVIDTVAYTLALQLKRDPTDMFHSLRVVKAGGKLNGNPEFIQWLQYVMKYRAKRGEFRFKDDTILDLLRKTKPEAELVTLFQSVRRVPDMKTIADNLQVHMVLSSASSHRLVNDAWLKAGESPQQVYKILSLAGDSLDNNPLFIQWLRYIKLLRAQEVFSDLQTLNFYWRNNDYGGAEVWNALSIDQGHYGFEKKIAENLQTRLYQKWMDLKVTPEELASLSGVPNPINFSKLPRNDPTYGNVEAYTMRFADRHSGKTLLEKLKKAV